MRIRTLTAILFFASLALFSRWLVTNQLVRNELPQATQRSTIDYDLENFKAKNFGINGKLAYNLSAPRMSRNSLTGETLVTSPRLLWAYKKPAKKVILISDSGIISDDQNEVRLSGNVIVRSQLTNTQAKPQTTTIRTQELDFNQKNRLITSASLVSITAPGVRMSSLGMSANLEDEQISLHQQVKGRYETQ